MARGDVGYSEQRSIRAGHRKQWSVRTQPGPVGVSVMSEMRLQVLELVETVGRQSELGPKTEQDRVCFLFFYFTTLPTTERKVQIDCSLFHLPRKVSY